MARIEDEFRRAYGGECRHGPPLRAVLKDVTAKTAAGTLADTFPIWFWLAFGTGQASDKSITGTTRPNKGKQRETLREAVDRIRAL